MKVFDPDVNDIIDVLVVKIDENLEVVYEVDAEFIRKFRDANIRKIGEFEERPVDLFIDYLNMNNIVNDEIDGLLDNIYEDVVYEDDEGNTFFKVVR